MALLNIPVSKINGFEQEWLICPQLDKYGVGLKKWKNQNETLLQEPQWGQPVMLDDDAQIKVSSSPKVALKTFKSPDHQEHSYVTCLKLNLWLVLDWVVF